MPWRNKSFSGTRSKPSHSLSYPRVPSNNGHRLVSIKSEGAATVRKNLEVRKLVRKIPAGPQQSSDRPQTHIIDDSSDESAPEDDLIVRIDSPSRLSFRQAS